MLLKEFDLDNYLFGTSENELKPKEINKIRKQIKREMMEIYTGQNINNM